MSTRTKLNLLPPEIREELDSRLIESDGANLKGICTWLAEKGYSISCSTLGRYSLKLRFGVDIREWLKKCPSPGKLSNEELFKYQAILKPFECYAEAIQREIDKRYDVRTGTNEAVQ